MKAILKLSLLFFVTVAYADQYKPVDYKISKLPAEDWGKESPVVKETSWDSKYKIQETPEPERNVASEKDEQSRAPSSSKDKPSPASPKPEAWPYTP